MKYILKWLMLFFGVSLLIFFTTRMMPVSPVEMLLQQYALPFTEENKRVLTMEYGLDKNIFLQYIKWVSNFIRGNFGNSYLTRASISEEMFRRLPYSFVLGLGSLLFAMLLSFFLGYLAAIKENGVFDIFTRIISIFSLSVPSFIGAIVLIYYFGVKIKLIKFFTDGHFWGVVFAFLIMAFYQVGSLSRIVRKKFVELKKESYVKYYLIRGFKIEYVLLRHCYKPVLYSLFSASISRFSSVIGGSTVVEFAFTIPGISLFLINSITARDYNVIQAYILFVFLWMFLVHVVFDFCLVFLKERNLDEKIFNVKKIIIFSNIILLILLFFLSKKLDTDINLDRIFMPISSENLLGTDNLGRDVFSVLIVGGMKTLQVVAISVSISFFVGTFLGMISGFYENYVSSVIKSIVDLMMIIPSLISAIIITSIFGITPITAGITLGMFGIGSYMNQAEALTKREKNKEYIQASKILGVPNYIILCKNIFLNIVPELFVNLGNTASSIILQYAGLTFIGLGADYTKPDWGTMLYLYRIYIIKNPLLVLAPTLSIFWVALSFNLFFDGENYE